mmetsp:Transcript_26233/g.66722  ORF Transcript_26233/g.66722 Transcript_26233/m.66722 type:complete len:297 (+) Transcript_26233:1535-2425(+)
MLMFLAPNMMKKTATSWRTACAMMWRHIKGEIKGSFLPYGFLSSRSAVGGSVARARAARASMMRFTHSNCTAFRGVPCPKRALAKDTASATMLMVSWNWRKRRTLSNTERPHMTAFTMEEKLSSMMTTSDASFATSVPLIPMLIPTSASFKAGASFVPSPVTATTSPRKRRRRTRISLSVGVERASTWSLGSTLSFSSSLSTRNSGPVMATPPSVKIPHSRAMLFAVRMLSPVTILTMIPACLHLSTASGTSGRRGSWMPMMPRQIMSVSGSSPKSSESFSRYARQRVRRPESAMR